MRAYEIVSAGGSDALALSECETPRPRAGKVLVRMRASSVNYRDLGTVESPEPRGIRDPTIPNSDGAGEVLATGEPELPATQREASGYVWPPTAAGPGSLPAFPPLSRVAA